MAEFRNIHTRIWTDAWYSELEPDAKLLFVYLFSNPNASISGMYELPKRNIAMDTGIAPERVDELMTSFAAAGKVYYESGIIWVVNLKKYNDVGDGVKIAVRIAKDISAISDCRIKQMYCEYYGIPYLNSKIPYSESEIPHPEKESEKRRDGIETETDTETESETETRESGEIAKTAISPALSGADHPAILAVKQITGLMPQKGAYGLVIDRLGDNPDLEKLRAVFAVWCAAGFKPVNVGGILDWYRDGIPKQHKARMDQMSGGDAYQKYLSGEYARFIEH